MAFDAVTYALAKKYTDEHGGGGGGGTTNYNQLSNKPQIAGTTLQGDKSLSDLGIQEELTAGDGISIENGVISATGGGGSAELTDDLTTAIDVGGIEAGTTYTEGTSLETILRDMLEPTLYPTIIEPSVTISAPQTLFEKGTSTYVKATVNVSRGSITPAYGTNGYRAGASYSGGVLEDMPYWSYKSSPSGSWTEWFGDQTSAGFPVAENKCAWRVTDTFDDGEQPKDSKGNDYLTPYHDEYYTGVTSNGIVFNFVYAMWANTANIATVAKLSLINNVSTKQRDMVFPAQTIANPEVFDIPASWNVTAVQVKNDLSGQYEDASSQFTITDTTHDDAGGNSINYKRYTFNMGMATGSRTVRVKWS